MLYAGIDEAGYGPVLGPLCVALCAVEVPWTPGADAPDVWKLLSTSVCRLPSKSKRGRPRIAVNDSKKLKLSNSIKGKHPLVHLERAVMAFDSICRERTAAEQPDAHDQPLTDTALFSRLGAALSGHDWYAADPTPLPLGSTHDHQRLTNLHLASACERQGINLHHLCCRTMCEREFNQRLRGAGIAQAGHDAEARNQSKAAVSFGVVGALLRLVWERCAHTPAGAEPPRVVVDRQGGRTSYATTLEGVFPDAVVHPLGDSPARSVYDLVGTGASNGRRMRVSFQVEAEQSHFPVALASMTAKLVRELAMARFNRYWCARVAELKPTAGYSQDGERWLRDARPALGDEIIRELRRIA